MNSSDRERVAIQVAEKMIDLAQRFLDKRTHVRNQVSKELIEPTLTKIKITHEDFSKILLELNFSMKRIIRAKQRKANNLRELCDKELKALENLFRIRAERHYERRLLFAETEEAAERWSSPDYLKKFAFSTEEISQITEYLSLTKSYLSWADGMYGHDMLRHLRDAYELLEDDFSNDPDGLQIKEFIAEIQNYIDDREKRWSDIATAFTNAKLRKNTF